MVSRYCATVLCEPYDIGLSREGLEWWRMLDSMRQSAPLGLSFLLSVGIYLNACNSSAVLLDSHIERCRPSHAKPDRRHYYSPMAMLKVAETAASGRSVATLVTNTHKRVAAGTPICCNYNTTNNDTAHQTL